MASYSYGSESTTKISNSSNASSWTGYWLLSSINEQIKSKIKDYSNISNFKFTVYAKENGGTFNSDIDIFFAKSDNSSLSSLHSGDNCVYDSSYSNWTLSGVASAVQSGNKNAGRIVYSSADRICIKLAKTTSLGTNRTWSAYYTISCDYTPPTFVISLSAGAGGTVSGAGTYNVDSSATIKATPNSGYRFVKWSDGNTSATRTITKTTSDISANVTNLSYTATFEKIEYTATFKNADGTVVKSLTVQSGSTLGAAFEGSLTTIKKSGYTFGGWIPCAPAVKTDGTVLDSRQYLGDKESAQALHTKYKDYTDKLSVHIEAHMSDWASIKIDDKTGRQIISCTQSGGWGLGWQANTNGHGAEINAGGYKGIDLGFGTSGEFSNNEWYAFDIVFSGGTFEVYVNGTKKGTQSTSSTAISYHPDNTIFVGAEAGTDDTTPAGNYFIGFISNVFIANQGTRLVTATSSTTVTGNVDYYPIWKKNYTIVFKNGDGSTLETVTAEHGKTPSCSKTPTKASTAEYNYTWDTSNPWSPAISKANDNQTYTPNFIATKRKYTVTFKDENGTTLKTESVDYNSKPTPPANPTKTDTAQWDYTFDGWYDANGNKWTSDTTITSATTFTARYTATKRSYAITVSAGVGGTVSGGGTYEYGKSVDISATPNAGYKFKQWSDGNTSNPRTVTVTGNATYTAEFESAMPEFTLVQMLYNNKQISKDNKVPAGQSFRLVAGVK